MLWGGGRCRCGCSNHFRYDHIIDVYRPATQVSDCDSMSSLCNLRQNPLTGTGGLILRQVKIHAIQIKPDRPQTGATEIKDSQLPADKPEGKSATQCV
jgi:hypothetical protein